jgi:Cof subfamily protein (haloacid dehalogenase superfamily)
MNYRMMVLDLDGTLLNSEKVITPKTKDALMRISDHVKIVLASARGFYRIREYTEVLQIADHDNYTIAYNGSVVCRNDGNILLNNCLPKDKTTVLTKYAVRHPEAEWFYYTDHGRISLNDISDCEKYLAANSIYKMICTTSAEEIRKIRNQLPEAFFHEFQITSSEPTRIEFVKYGITKDKAIQLLCETLNISREETIAVGDGENDVPMIRWAGCGIAMGNAPDGVKKEADMITADNDHDGIADFIEQLKL